MMPVKFIPLKSSSAGFILLILCLGGCGRGQKEIAPHIENASQICAQSTDLRMEDRLFLGADMQGREVRSKEFQEFLDKIVTPAFPEGLSVSNVQGQWKYKKGQIQKEHSWVIDLVYEPTKKREQAIRKIIQSYKELFHQEAVLRLHASICAHFS